MSHTATPTASPSSTSAVASSRPSGLTATTFSSGRPEDDPVVGDGGTQCGDCLGGVLTGLAERPEGGEGEVDAELGVDLEDVLRLGGQFAGSGHFCGLFGLRRRLL